MTSRILTHVHKTEQTAEDVLVIRTRVRRYFKRALAGVSITESLIELTGPTRFIQLWRVCEMQREVA